MMIIPETPDRPTMWTRLSLHKDISSRYENYEYPYIELHSLTLDPKLERRDIPIKNAYYKGRQYLKVSSTSVSLPIYCGTVMRTSDIFLASTFTVAAFAQNVYSWCWKES